MVCEWYFMIVFRSHFVLKLGNGRNARLPPPTHPKSCTILHICCEYRVLSTLAASKVEAPRSTTTWVYKVNCKYTGYISIFYIYIYLSLSIALSLSLYISPFPGVQTHVYEIVWDLVRFHEPVYDSDYSDWLRPFTKLVALQAASVWCTMCCDAAVYQWHHQRPAPVGKL